MADSPLLSGVAVRNDRLATLKVLRRRLAAELDECRSARDVSSLSQRLMDVLAQIEVIEREKPEMGGTVRDEVARKRSERASPSKAPGRT